MTRVRDIGGRVRVGNAEHQWTERRGLVVEIDDGGLTGFGEASPLPGISPATLDQVRAELESAAGPTAPCAMMAVELARLDLEARARGTSIAALLGEPTPVRASQLLGDPRDDRQPEQTISVVKFKVGPFASWPEQAAAIDSFVSLRPWFELRLDFNSSLDSSEACRVLADIEERGWPIDFVEDPCANLTAIKTEIDIAADAIFVQPDWQQRASELAGHVEVAVLKPALIGGLRATFARARSAIELGFEPIVSHLMDGPIALHGYAELACAIAGLSEHPRAAGVGPHAALAAFGSDALENLRDGFLHPRLWEATVAV